MNVSLNIPLAEALHLRLISMANDLAAQKGECSAALVNHTRKLGNMILDFSIFDGWEETDTDGSTLDIVFKRMDYLTKDDEGWILKRGLQHSCGTDKRLANVDFETAISGLLAAGRIEMQRRARITGKSKPMMSIQLRKIERP